MGLNGNEADAVTLSNWGAKLVAYLFLQVEPEISAQDPIYIVAQEPPQQDWETTRKANLDHPC